MSFWRSGQARRRLSLSGAILPRNTDRRELSTLRLST
jgi:hypothetical protein